MAMTDESSFGAFRASPDRRARERVLNAVREAVAKDEHAVVEHRSGLASPVIHLSVDARADGVWVEFEMVVGANPQEYLAVVRSMAMALARQGFGSDLEAAGWLEAFFTEGPGSQ